MNRVWLTPHLAWASLLALALLWQCHMVMGASFRLRDGSSARIMPDPDPAGVAFGRRLRQAGAATDAAALAQDAAKQAAGVAAVTQSVAAAAQDAAAQNAAAQSGAQAQEGAAGAAGTGSAAGAAGATEGGATAAGATGGATADLDGAAAAAAVKAFAADSGTGGAGSRQGGAAPADPSRQAEAEDPARVLAQPDAAGAGAAAMPPAYVTVCSAVKDQHADVREWLAYHRAVGVDRFYLVDTGSASSMSHEVADYIGAGVVDFTYNASLVPTPGTHGPQLAAYELCLAKARARRVLRGGRA